MATIWKFQLHPTDSQTVDMPAGADILHFGVQTNTLCLWAVVDPDAPMEKRQIELRGTGHFADNVGRYLGTVIDELAGLVFHAFDGVRK